MGYKFKRYSHSISRRAIIIPSIFFFILFIQHAYVFVTSRSHTTVHVASTTIPIQGQWKSVRRELGLPVNLSDEIQISVQRGPMEPLYSRFNSPSSRPRPRLSSRLFKRSLINTLPNEPPELYFSVDALDEPSISYQEFQELLESLQSLGSRGKRQTPDAGRSSVTRGGGGRKGRKSRSLEER